MFMGDRVWGFCSCIRHSLLGKGLSMLLNFEAHHITTLLTNFSMSPYFTRVKTKFTIFSKTYNALYNPASDSAPLTLIQTSLATLVSL